MKKIKIIVITGGRADYGLLSYFLKDAKKSFNLKLVVTGSHLNNSFGNSIDDIIKDKIKISKKIDVQIKEGKGAVANSISIGIKKFNEYFEKNNSDFVILLGDRYEILSCAIAAAVMRYPIIHLHGGETTTNSYDEYFRHSISIFSQYHFVAAKKYYNRLIQLGNSPKKIFLVGGLGASNIKRVKYEKKENLEKIFKIKFKKKNILLIYHPETLEKNYGIIGLKNTLKVLSEYKDYLIIISSPNADTNYSNFKKLINFYTKKNKNFKVILSLKHEKFLSILKNSDLIIGNSSSGLLEAPSLKVPTINIGNRQHGRLRSPSVIDCSYNSKEIQKKINLTLKSKKFFKFKNPYDHGDSIKKIINTIKKIKISNKPDKKKFFDLTENIKLKNIFLK